MRWFVFILALLLPLGAMAQEEDDKSRLTRFLEDTLSGTGRTITINGFQGALSSVVTMEELTVADETGVWLRMTDATLDWNRAAVLAGRIDINTLSAKEIHLIRPPVAAPAAPSPEATPFALPELPVSVNIGEVDVAKAIFDESIMGIPAALSLTGAVTLADGDGQAKLNIERVDGAKGHFRLSGSFSNATSDLAIDLKAREDAQGIVATLLKIPDQPPLELSIVGQGPLDAFYADIKLASAGAPRLQGQIALESVANPDAPVQPVGSPLIDPIQVISADIRGDLAPLFAPKYRAFFGPDVAFTTVARRFSDGRMRLDQLLLTAAALELRGDLALAPSGMPERFALDLALETPDGAPILLPTTGPDLLIRRASLTANFNSALGDGWSLSGVVSDFERGPLIVQTTDLKGSGRIQLQEPRQLTANVRLGLIGMETSNPEIVGAIGDSMTTVLKLDWAQGSALNIQTLDARTKSASLVASGKVQDVDGLTTVSGEIETKFADLSKFQVITERQVSGALSANMSGSYVPSSGAFDVDVVATGVDLGVGEPSVDGLLQGESVLAVSAQRDQTGIAIENAAFESDASRLQAAGTLSSEKGRLTYSASLDDLQRFVSDVSGPVDVSGVIIQEGGGRNATLQATAPGEAEIKAEYDLRSDGAEYVLVDAVLGDTGRYFSSLAGKTSLVARADHVGENWQVDADLEGQAGSFAKLQGSLAEDFQTADIGIVGELPLAVANRSIRPQQVTGVAGFDLKLTGAPSAENISGTISTKGARFAAPTMQIALENIASTVSLQGGSANLDVSSNLAAGGTVGVRGTVDLAPPFAANLSVGLGQSVIQLGSLFQTSLTGDISVTGPLATGPNVAGQIDLGPTEVKISSNLGGGSSIPDVTHLSEPSKSLRTRTFAGLFKEPEAEGGSASNYAVGLDLNIVAQNRIFVRGMGLDSEFDGALQVAGTSTNVLTTGEFDLVRGRLDFLSKRFDLDEGIIRMEGGLVPYIRLVAISKNKDATFSIILEGLATDPDIDITSNPELPEDEVLSQMLFGRDLSAISPLQAAQLAAAAATLSGHGTEGLMGKLRKSTGLSNIDLTTNEDGNAGLSVGTYINEKIYTDIGVDSTGLSTIQLNMDLTDSVTVKGRVDSNSETAVGIYYQFDY